MSAEIAHELHGEKSEERAASRSPRARLVLALGPVAVLAGVAWALLQPWRLTLLHPHGQGFWWLFAEPPLYVVLVGILFRRLVAPGLVEDLERE
jgi:uncharacterized membrane protein